MSTADLSLAIGAAGFLASAGKYLKDQRDHRAERLEQTVQLREQTVLLQQIRDYLISKDALG